MPVPATVSAACIPNARATLNGRGTIVPTVNARPTCRGTTHRMTTTPPTTTKNVRAKVRAILKRGNAIATLVLRGMPVVGCLARTIAAGTVNVSRPSNAVPCN